MKNADLKTEISLLRHQNNSLLSKLTSSLDSTNASIVKKLYDSANSETNKQLSQEEEDTLAISLSTLSLSYYRKTDSAFSSAQEAQEYGDLVQGVDPTIIQYLQNPQKKRARHVKKTFETEKSSLSIAKSALKENVSRFFGVTMFPIAKAVANESPESLFGIRFDVYNQRKKEFETPHYIIFKKKKAFLKVFQTTVPEYLAVTELQCHESDFITEIYSVYNSLSADCQRRIVFDEIGSRSEVSVDANISHSKVTLEFKTHLKFVVWCDLLKVVKCQGLRTGVDNIQEEQLLAAEGLLTGSLDLLNERVGKVILLLGI